MGRKIFVAVHGVGDQTPGETVQGVAKRVLSHVDGDHGKRVSYGTFVSANPIHWIPDSRNPQFGFAEVHWANICRQAATEGHVLEKAVPWSKTMIDRIRDRKAVVDESKRQQHPQNADVATPPDYGLIRAILGEMGEGLELIDKILWLAPKLGLPKFAIGELVDQYLGDVQFVAEFDQFRTQILNRFHDKLADISRGLQPDDEIYVISHSEGTVVSCLGLLMAARESNTPQWLKQVRGWMTFGSPIDKHLIIWNDLFRDLESGPTMTPPERKIAWRNYYDFGDPVGFSLDSTREWMRKKHWDSLFDLQVCPCSGKAQGTSAEYGFTRYWLPGKAHVDYWGDRDVFGDFLSHVAGLPAHTARPLEPVKTKPWAFVCSYCAPYVGSLMILLVGVYLLIKGAWFAQGTAVELQHAKVGNMSREVISLTLLLAGTTVFARIPRIAKTGRRLWLVISAAVFVLCAVLFQINFRPESVTHIADLFLGPKSAAAYSTYIPAALVALALLVAVNAQMLMSRWKWRGLVLVEVVLAAVLPWGVQRFDPSGISLWPIWPTTFGAWCAWLACCALAGWTMWKGVQTCDRAAGLWPLLGPGVTCVCGLCAAVVALAKTSGAVSIWPLIVSGIMFCYLWWLAVILLDLTFVWHRYIKHERMVNWLRDNLIER